MAEQIEKNKEKLLDEMERLAEKPMNREIAMYLGAYRQAYKAMCLVKKERTQEMGGDEMTSRQIKHWMEHLENEDGTTGPRYTKDQVEQYRRSLGINCDLEKLYAATNMMYSDYCRVLRKYGADRPEIYVELGAAFLDDKDAGASDKLAAYYEYIVEGE